HFPRRGVRTGAATAPSSLPGEAVEHLHGDGHRPCVALAADSGGPAEGLPALPCHGLRVGVLEQALASVPAALAGGTPAAHGGIGGSPGGGVAFVDVDVAAAQPVREAPPACGIAGPHGSVEPVAGVVGTGHGLVVAADTVEGDDGPEGLLRADPHGL